MTNGIIIGLSSLGGVWLGWYAVPLCLSIAALLLLIERDRRWPLLLAALLFSVLGTWRSQPPDTLQTNDALATSTGAIGTIDSFPRPSGGGHRMLFRVTDLCVYDQCVPAQQTVLLYANRQQPPLARGDFIHLEWRLDPLAELSQGYRSYVRGVGGSASAYARDVRVIRVGPTPYVWLAAAHQTVTDQLSSVLTGDVGALASGIVTGDDSALTDEVAANFRATGTGHITAVSGQNVTIILGFLSLWWHPKTVLKRRLFHTGLILAIWSYALFVGLEPPALRAAIVASLTIIGRMMYRRPDPVTLLCLTLGTMALWNPLIVHGVGFWLSATASMALCLALPESLSGSGRRRALQIALGPIVASLATMPIVLSTFGTWSPVSILANILMSPVVTLAFWATYPFAILATVAPAVADLFAWIPGIPLDTSLAIARWLAPISAQIRVDALAPAAMLALWLPIGTAIWLLSGESDRWIHHGIRRFPRPPSTARGRPSGP